MAQLQDADIINLCQSPDRSLISNPDIGTRVVKADGFAIKFGAYVFAEKAVNQHVAYTLLDPKIVRVPRVVHFFTDSGIGYLVMEYIRGTRISKDDIKDLELCVQHLHSFYCPRPGTMSGKLPAPSQCDVSGGVSRSLLWPEYINLILSSGGDLEDFIRPRLVGFRPDFSLSDTRFCLCHMDIAPRNVLRTADGPLAFLDWSFAGYYPRAFEIATLRSAYRPGSEDQEFFDLVEQQICCTAPLSSSESDQVDVILQVAFNCERYSFDAASEHRKKLKRRRRKRVEGKRQDVLEHIPATFAND